MSTESATVQPLQNVAMGQWEPHGPLQATGCSQLDEHLGGWALDLSSVLLSLFLCIVPFC